jgi:CHAT domain-containing protein/tetratricopeptide (TPR) repeat protein
VRQAQGEYAAARPLYERALALRTEVLGERHPDYAISLNNLASVLEAQGDYATARPLYERALAVRKKVLGERHPDYAASLNNLAALLQAQGDYAAARPLYERALALRKELLGERHLEYAQSLSNLAVLLQAQADYAAARPLYERALAVYKEVLGERHPLYAGSLHNLAALLEAQGNYTAARPLLERALALRKEVLGERHPHYAQSLHNLASVLEAQGDYAAARPLYEQALAVCKEVLGERHPDSIANLHNLAAVLQAQGDYAAARPLYEQTLAECKAVLGERHLHYALSLQNLAALLWAQGDSAAARPLAVQGLEIDEARVAEALPAVTTREQIALMADARRALMPVLSLSTGESDRDADGYRHVLAWKGLAAEAAAARIAAERPEAQAHRAALAPLRARLNVLYLARVPPERADEHARQVRDLAAQVEVREAALAAAVGWRPTALDPARIATALPDDAVLVDVLRYIHWSSPVPGKHGLRAEWNYLAFVVRRGRPPVRVELGPADPIADAVASWRVRLQKDDDDEELGRNVARLVWEPLKPHLKDAHTILISPDEDLCFLPWGALPDVEPGSFLLRSHAFGVLGSARDLLALAGTRSARATGGLLAVGGVDYGHGAAAATGTIVASASRAAGVDRATLAFHPLPGTKDEARAIVALARRLRIGATEPLGGKEATADRLAAAMSGERYLHLATHGYFARQGIKSALAPDDDPITLKPWEGMGRREVVGYFPGLLSGLVWAGASAPPSDPASGTLQVGAGIMTAEAISALNLKGCELAVLSACETGLGRTAGGEGVLGLQRAFQQAGCRTVVASLWKVDDQATASLMERFYTNHWEKKLPTLEALRQAQLSILDDPNLGAGGSPRLWAAWTLGGDPGGLPCLESPTVVNDPRPGAEP